MKQPKCMACGSRKFEMAQVTPEGSTSTFSGIQCAQCSVLYGIVGRSLGLDEEFDRAFKRMDDFFVRAEKDLSEIKTVRDGFESLKKLFKRFLRE